MRIIFYFGLIPIIAMEVARLWTLSYYSLSESLSKERVLNIAMAAVGVLLIGVGVYLLSTKKSQNVWVWVFLTIYSFSTLYASFRIL